ncbi:MAG: 3-methyladenine DNA glycosylase [Geoglossum umbratile]|nr:MAG: 3-methyladenine DNA glycosylase [Geoglossum umbratile]
MALRRSARVNAISRPPVPPSKEDQIVEKVEPNRVAKRGRAGGKMGGNPKPLMTETVSSPSTPKRKRNGALGPPKTPTGAGLMSVPHGSRIAGNDSPISANRPADPHRTNAPLVSPETSRVVAYAGRQAPSGTKATGPLSTRTTENILEGACAHLVNVDPTLKHVIDKHHCRIFSSEGLAEEIDPFVTLSSSIISQQVSGQAARSIKRKFILLFNSDLAADSDEDLSKYFPTPSQVAACDLATLRTAGLSGRKAEYIQGLAQKFASGELSTEMLIKASDEEVMEKLIAVRGLGRWSVEMFSCFGLKRMDIFSTGDLGVQRGMATYVGKDVSKMKAKGGGKWKYMPEKDMLEISAKFAPYRSLFMWYMWRIENVDVEAMQK